ncbi:phasin family protein [Sphingomonas sp. RB3P16]|uniref:phasin family protein n=1 Tax=Parasphingomonas frigoris TaxID=3096163 RepID=UPI002FC9A8C9
MAIKGPKSKALSPTVKPVTTVAAASAESIPAALAASPVVQPASSSVPMPSEPPSPKKPAIAAKPPVAPVAAAAPVSPQPVPVAKVPAPKPVPVATVSAVASPAAAPTSAPPPLTVEAPQPVAAAAATIAQKEVATMETIQSAAENGQARAQAMFADVNDRTKTAMEKGSKMIEDMNEFSKGNIEAIVESSKIAAKGIKTMGQEAADFGRKQFESATAVLKTLSSVKSPTDFLKLHSDFMRSTFDSMVAETSKNTESMLKLAGEIAQPISNRVAVAAEKIKIPA